MNRRHLGVGRLGTIPFVAIVSLISISPAHAQTASVFSGTFQNGSVSPGTTVAAPGEPLTATVMSDLDPPTEPCGVPPCRAVITSAMTVYSLDDTATAQIGNTPVNGSIGYIIIHDNYSSGPAAPPPPYDAWTMVVLIPGYNCDWASLQITLRDYTATTLNSTDFFVPQSIAGFPEGYFFVFEICGGVGTLPTILARGSIDSVGVVAIDTDSDGVSDAEDNCPTVANVDQTNSDSHPAGDACVPPGTIPPGVSVGANPVIGANTQIDKSVTIGDNANIGSTARINKDAQIGDDVSIGDGTTLNQNVIMGNDVTIGVNVVIAKDVIIDNGVTIGDAAIINQGVHLCPNSSIGASISIPQKRRVNTGVAVPPSSHLPLGTCSPP